MPANFTPPASVPDYFGQSVTPGSQQQVPIAPGSPGLAPVGIGVGPAAPAAGNTASPLGGSTITGVTTPGFDLPEVDVNSPVVVGGAGSGGSAPNTGSGSGTSTTGGTTTPQVPTTGGSGGGLAAIGGFAGNWFVRIALIALGIVLVAAAAWELTKERTQNA